MGTGAGADDGAGSAGIGAGAVTGAAEVSKAGGATLVVAVVEVENDTLNPGTDGGVIAVVVGRSENGSGNGIVSCVGLLGGESKDGSAECGCWCSKGAGMNRGGGENGTFDIGGTKGLGAGS